ncbi:unnamed protein product [Heligmosomoides polygyrus]|uniref:Uncharacterized protein n=1 Tax=Heligmosomoides polygyrus TaxID=6339 RepID=A0A183F1X7_HELPZ|nr:unnamed protein product [Heligmosomoides polygyrus]
MVYIGDRSSELGHPLRDIGDTSSQPERLLNNVGEMISHPGPPLCDIGDTSADAHGTTLVTPLLNPDACYSTSMKG